MIRIALSSMFAANLASTTTLSATSICVSAVAAFALLTTLGSWAKKADIEEKLRVK